MTTKQWEWIIIFRDQTVLWKVFLVYEEVRSKFFTLLYILDVTPMFLCHVEEFISFVNLCGLYCGWTSSQSVTKLWNRFGINWKAAIGSSASPIYHEITMKYVFIFGRYSRGSELALHIIEWVYLTNVYRTQKLWPPDALY